MMAEDQWVEFSCVEIEQPLGNFYVGVIDASDLIDISYADVRRIDERDVERYLGIQRPLSRDRVRELGQYVNTIDATFPTSILLAISSNDAEFLSDTRVMKVRRDDSVAKIIDGQHRIAGLELADGTFQSVITVFIDMDIEDQANVFATINLKQTKVNRSLAYDLFEFAKSRSPQKTAHNVARLLNFEEGSPLEGMIKLLGLATVGGGTQTLTQALVVDQLLDLMTDNPMKDRDELRRGRRLHRLSGDDWKRRPFRNLFVDEKDALIARIVWNFFQAVDERWPASWRHVETGFILNRTTGFSALMKFLGVLYPRLSTGQELVEASAFIAVLANVDLDDDDFHRDTFVPGQSGINALFRTLSKALPVLGQP